MLVSLSCAAAAVQALPASPASAQEHDPRGCISWLAPIPSGLLVRRAVEMLEQCGHDPQSFGVELRLEDADHPDSPRPDRRLEPSVIFRPLPLQGFEGYAVRVQRAIPCGIGWVWEPQRFTAWQTAVVARARAALEAARPLLWSGISDVQVAESRDYLGFYLWSSGAGESADPRATIVMRKSDLSIVKVE